MFLLAIKKKIHKICASVLLLKIYQNLQKPDDFCSKSFKIRSKFDFF